MSTTTAFAQAGLPGSVDLLPKEFALFQSKIHEISQYEGPLKNSIPGDILNCIGDIKKNTSLNDAEKKALLEELRNNHKITNKYAELKAQNRELSDFYVPEWEVRDKSEVRVMEVKALVYEVLTPARTLGSISQLRVSGSYNPVQFREEIATLADSSKKEQIATSVHELVSRIHFHPSLSPYDKEQLFKAIEGNESISTMYAAVRGNLLKVEVILPTALKEYPKAGGSEIIVGGANVVSIGTQKPWMRHMKTSSSYLPEHFQKEIEALSSGSTKEKIPSQIHELIVRIHHHQSLSPYHKDQFFKAIEKNETLSTLYKEATGNSLIVTSILPTALEEDEKRMEAAVTIGTEEVKSLTLEEAELMLAISDLGKKGYQNAIASVREIENEEQFQREFQKLYEIFEGAIGLYTGDRFSHSIMVEGKEVKIFKNAAAVDQFVILKVLLEAVVYSRQYEVLSLHVEALLKNADAGTKEIEVMLPQVSELHSKFSAIVHGKESPIFLGGSLKTDITKIFSGLDAMKQALIGKQKVKQVAEFFVSKNKEIRAIVSEVSRQEDRTSCVTYLNFLKSGENALYEARGKYPLEFEDLEFLQDELISLQDAVQEKILDEFEFQLSTFERLFSSPETQDVALKKLFEEYEEMGKGFEKFSEMHPYFESHMRDMALLIAENIEGQDDDEGAQTYAIEKLPKIVHFMYQYLHRSKVRIRHMELRLAHRVHGNTSGKSYFEIKKEHGYKEGWGETSLTEDFIRGINKMPSADALEAQELLAMHFYSLATELIETIANGKDESDISVSALRSHLGRFVKIIETKSPDNDSITLTLLLLSRFETSFKEENVSLPQGEVFKNKLLVTLQELAKDPEKCRKLLSAENAARMVSFLYLHHTALESISALEEKLLYTVYVKQDNEKVSKYLVGKATSPDFQSPDFGKVSTALAELIAGKYPDKLLSLVRYLKDLVSTYEAIGEKSLYNESLEIIGTLYLQPVVDKIQMEQISLRELLGNLEERCEAKKMQIEAKKVLANLKEKAFLITQYTQEGDIHELYTDFKDDFLAINKDDFDGLGDIYKQIVSIEGAVFGAYLKIVQEAFGRLFVVYREEELSETDSSKRIDQLFQRSRSCTGSDSFLDDQFEIYNDIKNRREAFESHMKNLSDASITVSESSMESGITMVIESMFEENIFIEGGGIRQSIVSKTLEKVEKSKFETMLLHATDICIMNILENPPFGLDIHKPETLVQTCIQVFEIARGILPKSEEVISILSQLYAIKKGIQILSQVEKMVSGETAEGDGTVLVHQVRSEVQQILLRNKITVAKLSLEILKIINGAGPKHFPRTKHLLIEKIS